MKQVLAVAVASLLIAVAIIVRGAIDDGDGPDTDGRDGDGPADTELVVACVRELQEACEALDGEIRIESPASTIASADEIDAWVTFDPWPAMAEAQQGRPLFGGDLVPVASSGLVLLTRTSALPADCDAEPDWACVVAGANPPALPDTETALGPLLFGHAALGWNLVARDGASFARQDFELPEFDAWRRSIEFSRDPIDDMTQLGPAGPVATGTTRATFETVVLTSREADNLEASPTAVPATVAVVVVGPSAERIADDDRLRDGLDELGWDLDSQAVTTGLPIPGVLIALQEIA